MANKQLLAKLGVFVLLGLNVAAYYYFWPRQNVETRAQNEPKGETHVFAAPQIKPQDVPKPKEIAAAAFKDAQPLPPPEPIKKTAPDPIKNAMNEETTADEMVRRLLDHLEKEKKAAPLPPPNPFDNEKPRALPPLSADPIGEPGKIGVTSPLTPKSSASPWFLSQEQAGKQTLLIGKLQPAPNLPPVAEFRILCDRVDTRSSEVLALGNVVFTGAGLRGECQRVVLPLLERKVILEDQVRIGADMGIGLMCGDRFVWELPAPASSANRVTPVLGPPK